MPNWNKRFQTKGRKEWGISVFNFMKYEKFDHIFEIIVAVLLGVTALLTSYASWQGSLYGGSQATKYTEGAALQAEGNSMYNEQSQLLSQDMRIYDELNNLRIDMVYAEKKGDVDELELLEWKYDELAVNNASDELIEAIEWSDEQPEYKSPFDKEGFVDSYFAEAKELINQGYEMVESGKKDNSLGDILGLSTVIFSIVLFLLGILNTFDNKNLKVAIMSVSFVALVWAATIMLSVPMQSL